MSALYTSKAKAEEAVEKIRVFAQPLRLMILSCLLEGERAVGAIEQATGISQPALSQQLAELRRADLVQTRRTAKQVHYRLADATAVACVRTIESVFGGGQMEPGKAPEPNGPTPPKRISSSAAGFAVIT